MKKDVVRLTAPVVVPRSFFLVSLALLSVCLLRWAPSSFAQSGQAAGDAPGTAAGAPGASQAPDSAQAPTTSTTPREKEELHARILTATKQYSEAVKVYTQLAAENPRDAAYPNFAGIALMQLGDLDAARKFFQRSTKINKKFAAAYNNIGAIYFAQKHYPKAIRQYEKALSLAEQTAGFYSNLGYAYFGEKRYPEAFKAFQKAMALDPNTFQQNDRNGSVMQYRSVEDHGLFDFMLAKSYAQMGDVAHCAVYLRRAIDDGYKQVGSAETDPAFLKVRTEPEVKTILDEVAAQESKSASAPPGA
jgi:tetratricopeptide (TPR) repeat protein